MNYVLFLALLESVLVTWASHFASWDLSLPSI